MKLLHDQDFVVVISVVLGLLILSSLIGVILKRRVTSENAIKVVNNLNARTKAWWIMCVALF
ncbi:MAG: phosphatidate cytidylyltransferase, partial [Phycisphaeraceae bacterium JB051]